MDVLPRDPVAAAILLASTAAGDTGAALAALDPALRARVEVASLACAALRAGGREAAVSALITATATPIADGLDGAPPRVRAIVASLVARDRGGAWLRDAGAPRTGFRASAALRTTVANTEGDAWRA